MAKIKRASIYIKNRKVGSAGNSSLDTNNNTERYHGTDGIQGGSDGNPESELQFDTVIVETWEGAQQMLLDAAESQEEVTMSYLMGTKMKQGPFKCSRWRVSSEPKTGTLVGSFTFINTGIAKTA